MRTHVHACARTPARAAWRLRDWSAVLPRPAPPPRPPLLVLFLKYAVTTVSLSKFGMVYYNNLLSVPLLLAVAWSTGEASTALASPSRAEWASVGFVCTLVVSGVVGFALNGASLWCVQATSPSTFSMVGALNKIPLAVRVRVGLLDAGQVGRGPHAQAAVSTCCTRVLHPHAQAAVSTCCTRVGRPSPCCTRVLRPARFLPCLRSSGLSYSRTRSRCSWRASSPCPSRAVSCTPT
jgi:hypothetical protein